MTPTTVFRMFFYTITLSFMAAVAVQIVRLNHKQEISVPLGRVIASKGDWASMSNAVARARSGGTILLRPGTNYYKGWPDDIRIKSLSIMGSGVNKTVFGDNRFDSGSTNVPSNGHYDGPLCLNGNSPHADHDRIHDTNKWVKVGRSWYQSLNSGTNQIQGPVPLRFELQYYRVATNAYQRAFEGYGGAARFENSRVEGQEVKGSHGYDSEADFTENATVAPLHGIYD
jgi:hypothetical protein